MSTPGPVNRLGRPMSTTPGAWRPAANLKAELELRGLSQYGLDGVDRSVVANIIKGHWPKAETALAVTAALGKPFEWLFSPPEDP